MSLLVKAAVGPYQESKNLDRLKTPQVNPPAPTVHPSDEGVFKAAPSLKGGSQNEQPHLRFHQQPARLQKKGGSNSAATGALGVAVFRRQMQQV